MVSSEKSLPFTLRDEEFNWMSAAQTLKLELVVLIVIQNICWGGRGGS